jgi:Zn2+/Cd2+-exporting ATPase
MKKRLCFIIASIILFAFSMIVKFENVWINNIIFLISYLLVGIKILKKAIKNILRGKVFDENFLMSLATVGAFAVGEFPEAVMVMILYQIGELFQDYAVNKSRKSIASLMDIRPDYANVYRDDKIEKVNPSEVAIEEIIVVKPGEKIPLDGMVVEGTSMLDTSTLTGESVPRKIEVGDDALSGTINKTGLIKVKVTKPFGESTVNKILDLVENASSKKSKSEKFITKFAKYYTPTVVIIALIIAFVPPLIIQDATFKDWIYKALSFLVVSCPCALVISIPLGFFGGIGGASKLGILVKGSNALEALADVETVVFDKTGTLTKGVFEVQDVKNVEIEKEELVRLVAHAEKFSTHPVAESVKRFYNNEIDENIIGNIEEIGGYGIIANIENKEILVGNDKLMAKKDIAYEKCGEAGTILYVAIDNKFAGYILISDKIKDDSEKALKELKKMNIKKTVMLTGDRKEAASSVGEKLNLDEVFSELLPDGKVEKVEELMKVKSSKGKLAFVGDGINDAPVLVVSDVGIAMGGLGSDAAIEAADIVIMTDEPSKISKAIKIAKKTMRIVKENILFALAVKFIVLLLTVIGVSTMWKAVFADVGVSVIAILNSLRMLRVKKI